MRKGIWENKTWKTQTIMLKRASSWATELTNLLALEKLSTGLKLKYQT